MTTMNLTRDLIDSAISTAGDSIEGHPATYRRPDPACIEGGRAHEIANQVVGEFLTRILDGMTVDGDTIRDDRGTVASIHTLPQPLWLLLTGLLHTRDAS